MNKVQLRHRLSSSWGRKPLMWWRHRPITPQDIMVASYPRSGNTWLRFLLYELVTGQTADFDRINAVDSPCADFPHFQETPIVPPLQGRIIKTHEPLRKEYGRALYLVRDPREVAVSEYFYMQGRGLFSGSLNEFIGNFVQGRVSGYGAWHKHVQSWLDTTYADVICIRYEDLKLSGKATLASIATFLQLDTTPDLLNSILQHNTPKAMRQSEENAKRETFRFVNENARFVRLGQTNSWQETLTPAQVTQIVATMGPVMSRLGYD